MAIPIPSLTQEEKEELEAATEAAAEVVATMCKTVSDTMVIPQVANLLGVARKSLIESGFSSDEAFELVRIFAKDIAERIPA